MPSNAEPPAADRPARWRFFRSGGFDQVRLETGAELLALDQLDQKLWAALSCPTSGLEFDERTLQLIDSDGDGRIRPPELISAVHWAGSLLKDPDELIGGEEALALAAIRDDTEEARTILRSAREILRTLGKADAASITVEDTSDTAKIFSQMRFNGDGVVPPETAGDPTLQKTIEEIMACVGSLTDRSGKPGVSQELLDRFFAQAEAFSRWWQQAEADAANVLPFGDQTPAAAAVFEAVKAKIDDYFTRCRLAKFDSRAAGPLNPSLEEYQALSLKPLSAATDEVAAFPIASVAAVNVLPLTEGTNPAWAGAVAELRGTLVVPMFGASDELTAEQWAGLSAKFAAHEAWQASKEGAEVEALGLARVRELLENQSREAITALIAQDKDLEDEVAAIVSLDRLLRYHRDLHTLVNNFVAFRDFCTPDRRSIFEAGTLYLDTRACDLCIKVDDVAKHSAMADRARTFLAYCDCRRQGSAAKMSIVAAVTDGDSDDLMVGRNGVFYDRKGRDWDATITKLIEHPISVRQAFWSPYKRVARMIHDQIEKMATARDKAVETQATAGVTDLAKQAGEGKPKEAAPFDIAKFAGIFAAIGLAVGAIGTALASLVTGFMTLSLWQIPLAVLGLLLVISGPSMVIAYLNLRRRSLAPLLDANGWAVNTRAVINIPFGASLTHMATLPPGSQRSLRDPFAQKKTPWKIYTFLLVLLILLGYLWDQGHIQRWRDQIVVKIESTAQPQPAPAKQPETPEEAAKTKE